MPPRAVLLLFKHFWVAFILMTFLNGAIWWWRGSKHRERDPSLIEGYRSLVRGFVTWGNIPWLIMGAGILFGGERVVFSHLSIPVHVFVRPEMQLGELLRRLLLAGLRDVESGGAAVGLLILCKMIETGIAITARRAASGSTFSR